MPKVSVIMPAYNAEKYIAQAMDSILGQTFRDFEFIILNDCSKDRTDEIILSCKDPRIVYLKNEQNMGVAATLNKGLAAAKGNYIARMDADDISMPQRLEKQVEFLDSHPNTAVVGTDLERFGEGMSTQFRGFAGDPAQMKVDLLFACGLAHPSVMMRRAVIDELGGYDMAFEGLEDYELWCRVAQKHDVSVVNQMLFRYRVHPGQVTKNPSEKYLSRMRRLKTRQLEQLGLPTQGELADIYFNYCIGNRPKEIQQSVFLARFLESAAAANEKTGGYDREKLRGTFRSVLLGLAARLPASDGPVLCRETSLITPADLRKQRMKGAIKRILGRE